MANLSTNEDGMGPLECGRGRYYQNDYGSALEAFTEAINMSSGNLLHTALDHRAAAYEKLGQLQSALKDAKHMIELKPELAKGYLRCGKVLQLKEQNELALKIYERGLRKVKIGTDSDRTKLQSMFNRLWQIQNKDKCLDPLVYLPIELAQMVCKHLEMRDRVICLAVSKPWKRLLESSHGLWTTLDTTFTRKSVSQKSLSVHLKRSNYAVDHAIVTFRAAFDTQKWQYLFRVCKRLRELAIQGNGFIGDSLSESIDLAGNLEKLTIGANCLINPPTVFTILKACRNTLVEATFLGVKKGVAFTRALPGSCESLKYLRLQTAKDCYIEAARLCISVPNVRSLILEGCCLTFGHLIHISDLQPFENLKHLEQLSLRDAGLPGVIYNLPSTLKHLDLSKNYSLKSIRSTQVEPSARPLLEKFDCTETSLTGGSLLIFTAASIKTGSLKTLRLGGRFVSESRPPVTEEYPASESVEELSIARTFMPEKRLMQVIGLYPNLKRLDISSTKATGVCVKFCVEMGVKWLNLRECYGVSPDAVDWARGLGVEIIYKFESAAAENSWTRAFASRA